MMRAESESHRIPFLAKSRRSGTVIEVAAVGATWLSGTVVTKGHDAHYQHVPGYFSAEWSLHIFDYVGPGKLEAHKSLTVGDLA